jgi:hypothetical protein
MDILRLWNLKLWFCPLMLNNFLDPPRLIFSIKRLGEETPILGTSISASSGYKAHFTGPGLETNQVAGNTLQLVLALGGTISGLGCGENPNHKEVGELIPYGSVLKEISTETGIFE